MAFFPSEIMPKRLRKETQSEVDDNPSIYNARDYNIHHREIRAIQRALLGVSVSQRLAEENKNDSSSVLTQDSIIQGSSVGGNSVTDLVSRIVQTIDFLINRGYIGRYSGTVQSGAKVKIPSAVLTTQTNGGVSAVSSSIPVVDASRFPSAGVITKLNRLSEESSCTDGVPPAGGRCNAGTEVTVGYDGLLGGSYHATNQEVISYTSRTDTSFEGCTRGVSGSTAQNVSEDQSAIIICGRAAISFTHNFWAQGSDMVPNQFYLTHDATLGVTANLISQGGRTNVGSPLQDHIEIAWLLTVSGYFEDVNVSQLFSIQE